MNIAVISDTHGNLDGLRRAIREIMDQQTIDVFVHLGDNYEDAQVFDEFGCTYLNVPGVFSDYYSSRSVPNRLIKEFEGWRFLLTHTLTSHANDLADDPKPEALISEKQVDIVLFGHTHRPELAVKDSILFVNPGHLKEQDKKGFSATYAILNIDSIGINARIIGLGTGNLLNEVIFGRGD